jgi:glycosyltransferase involved in cell wall biosynthesis
LLKNFDATKYDLKHHALGSRMKHFHSPMKKRILYPVLYLYDLMSILYLLLKDRSIRIVQVNPSLIPVPLIRDALVIILARMLGKKVIVLFHGWKDHVLLFLCRHSWARFLFRLAYRRASLTLVLSSRFKEDLVSLGWTPSSIEMTTTMYEANEILPVVSRSGQRPRFIFLGRISHLKGVGELIDAAKVLVDRGVDFECLMVGHGDRDGVVTDYKTRVKEYGIDSRFHFNGHLTGRDKYQAYADSDIYVFPSWTEGCPTSVLEALGAGLFVISTDVGALRDVVCDGDNGKIVRCKDYQHLADILAWCCENIEDIRNRRQAIQKNAAAHYEAEIVSHQFKNIYDRLIYG